MPTVSCRITPIFPLIENYLWNYVRNPDKHWKMSVLGELLSLGKDYVPYSAGASIFASKSMQEQIAGAFTSRRQSLHPGQRIIAMFRPMKTASLAQRFLTAVKRNI